jgi:hypothetical protein
MPGLRPVFYAQAIGCQDVRAGMPEAGKPEGGVSKRRGRYKMRGEMSLLSY